MVTDLDAAERAYARAQANYQRAMNAMLAAEERKHDAWQALRKARAEQDA